MSSALVCAFGTPTLEHEPHVRPLFACQPCRDETARLCALFDDAVAAGEFDRQGYSPAERQAQRRKAAA